MIIPLRLLQAWFLFCVVLALATPSWSSSGTETQPASQEYRFDDVTVTARGIPAPASLTPGGVGVVEASDLRAQGGSSVTETLERIPGVSRSNDSPWSTDIVIRGLTRDSVVVLIDGMRVNMTTDINGRFGLVPAQQIERIEVLKGPVSALYGSGSVGGVVNIITRSGGYSETPRWHGGAGVSGTSNPGGGSLSSSLGYSTGSAWILGSVTARDHDDYLDGDGDRVENSSTRTRPVPWPGL
jgi:hemoglobin/transferrin/lactoferrin receptor protein